MSKKWLKGGSWTWAFQGHWVWCAVVPGLMASERCPWVRGRGIFLLDGKQQRLFWSSALTPSITLFPPKDSSCSCTTRWLVNSSCSHKWGRRKNFFMINAGIILFNSIDWNIGSVMGMWPSIQSASTYQQKLISGCEIHSDEHNWPLRVAPSCMINIT